MIKSNQLCLHDFHVNNSAKFTNFAGWEMPVTFGSALDEHIHTRTKVSIFDVSHMGEIKISGKEAKLFLDFVLTNRVSHIKNGQALYSPLCYEDGGTVDDLIAYKRSEYDFILCVNASNTKKDYEHLKYYVDSFDCIIENVSNSFGQLAIQGPLSNVVLSAVIGRDLTTLKRMTFIEDDFNNGHAIISRTGYTGEDGFEIYCLPEDIFRWASSFNEYQRGGDLKWGGLAARDSLRLEAGYPLYGHELSSTISPIQAGLDWTVDWEKGEFIGRDSLMKENQSGQPGRVQFYEVADRRIPRVGCEIIFRDQKVGKVLSGGYSPNLRKPIGSAWISYLNLKELEESGWKALVRTSEIDIKFGKAVLSQ